MRTEMGRGLSFRTRPLVVVLWVAQTVVKAVSLSHIYSLEPIRSDLLDEHIIARLILHLGANRLNPILVLST